MLKLIFQNYILIFLFFLSLESQAQNKHFYILGGGGEPTGETTIFDNNLHILSKFVKNSDWKTAVSFNGGHEKTEEILTIKFNKAKDYGGFTIDSYDSIVDEMMSKIKSGELKEGDQLMISIDTHGAETDYKELTHKIALGYGAATNLNNLAGAKVVNLDRLKELADLAAERGVKLAVIDLSCFSGNTLKIANSKTCVITGTGPEQYGYAGAIDYKLFKYPITFGSKFFSQMKKGKNLEQTFLDARTTGNVPDYPMISTIEGKNVDEKLYKLLVNFLDYNDEISLNLHRSYSKAQRSEEEFKRHVCERDNKLEELVSLLDQSKTMLDLSRRLIDQDFEKLKEALVKYRDFQKEYEEYYRLKFEVEKDLLKILEEHFSFGRKDWEGYSPLSFLNIDFEVSEKHFEKLLANSTTTFEKNMWRKNLESLKRKKQLVEDFKSKIPQEVKDKIKRSDEIYANSSRSYNLAVQVSVEAKRVYNHLYKAQPRVFQNPCRDFVL